MKILLELKFIGTQYSGFQVQPGKRTIQSAVQDAIERVYGERYPLKGCSRTDSGVHARQYFATFDTCKEIPTERIPLALNSNLPSDISVISAAVMSDEFHVRHDVLWKEYEYLLLSSNVRDPFYEGLAYRCKPIDASGLHKMRSAADAFIGRHDFSGFMSVGSKIIDTNREIKWLDIRPDGELIRIRIAADGFLYNMVRIIVGTLIEVASGKIDPCEMKEIIASTDRSRAGFTAPPEGLYLNRVKFIRFE